MIEHKKCRMCGLGEGGRRMRRFYLASTVMGNDEKCACFVVLFFRQNKKVKYYDVIMRQARVFWTASCPLAKQRLFTAVTNHEENVLKSPRSPDRRLSTVEGIPSRPCREGLGSKYDS